MRGRNGFLSLRAVWLIPILALCTIGLGLSGWLDYHYAPADALYRAISLFDIGNGYYTDGVGSTDWRFKLGRWTGIGVVFSAAITALGAILREQLIRLVARHARQQVVVVGGGLLSSKAYHAAQDAEMSVVWLGADAVGADAVSAVALPAPPLDRVATVRDHSRGAGQVLIAVDNDAEALSLVRVARAAAPEAFVTAIMLDEALAEDAAVTLNEPRTRILSGARIAARRLHSQRPPFLIAREKGHRRIHAVIVGYGQTGQAIARDLIVNCRTTYLDLPAITVIDPRAESLETVMRVRAPEYAECADFTFIEGGMSTEVVSLDPARIPEAGVAHGPITAIYVCLKSDAAALGAVTVLLSMLRAQGMRDLPIFIRLQDSNTVGGAGIGGTGLDVLIPFGDIDEVLAASEFLSREPDQLARQFSEAYRASLSPEARNDPANVSARDWNGLSETFRRANRDAVAHIPAKLASAGINPELWRGKSGLPSLSSDTPLFRTAEECEALARLEHERWNAQRRMDGWRWGGAPQKNEPMRRHPSLVPYDELTDEVQEFDRVYVRETQAILMTHGQAALGGAKP